jgi:hypothetical protein
VFPADWIDKTAEQELVKLGSAQEPVQAILEDRAKNAERKRKGRAKKGAGHPAPISGKKPKETKGGAAAELPRRDG